MQSAEGITRYLKEWEDGVPQALSRLVDLAYEQMVQQARGIMRSERPGHTLQTRALVHETYIRLMELRGISWNGKQHFYAMASSIMRRVLVDHARSKRARKRGGDAVRVTMDDFACESPEAVDVVALDAALSHLAKRDWAQSRIVELRCFGGLKTAEIAETLGLSPATVKRKWTLAQAFLFREMFGAHDTEQ